MPVPGAIKQIQKSSWFHGTSTDVHNHFEGKFTMTTYLVNHLRIPNGVPKPESLDYLEAVEATFLSYGGRWLALDAPVEALEGGWPGSVVLMEFPDRDSAKKWYQSPEYQEILAQRTDNTISDLILVDAVAPDFTSANWARAIRAEIAGASQPDGARS